MHQENFRLHYARTLAGWCHNLEENWDACVDEVGEGTARVWGLYMAGSRLAFERNEIQLHHVLAVKTDDSGHDDYPWRPTAGRPPLSEGRPLTWTGEHPRNRSLHSRFRGDPEKHEHPGKPVRRASSAADELSPHLVRLTLGVDPSFASTGIPDE
jgi:hypothetical protein